ncbi:MAG: hypothetical protein Ta2B_06720 [Termitinemataceae bacterium]|nr:MAG: hypothetical protein Ta2B_06720 [Termitinemataceae bacterium]
MLNKNYIVCICCMLSVYADVFAQAKLKSLPQDDSVRAKCNEIYNTLNPDTIVEIKASVKKQAAFSSAAWNATEKLKVLNAVSSISSLAGIQYYSESRKAMRTFYETSYVIKDETSQTKIADPLYDVSKPLPESFTLLAKQKDLSFGDNIYQYDYYVSDTAIYFVQHNLTPISYSFIPILKKEKLNTVVAFIDNKDSILIYVATMAKATLLPGMEKKVNASFTNRANALIKWFEGKVL